MGTVGTITLYAAIISVLVTVAAGFLGGRSRNEKTSRIAEYGTYATAGILTLTVGALQLALITLDLSLQYVADYTSSTLNVFYRVGAMWAGQGGSLLLWAWMVSLCGAWIAYMNRYKGWGVSAYTWGVFAVIAGLFTGLVVFLASPFEPATLLAGTDGFGLNPLLQDPLQIIHPLTLYAGYVLYTVPFALVVGALLAGDDLNGAWIRIANRWNIIAWIALTAGIVLGARWAYAELGWGGYWAWDPVENASLLPWLTGTVLLHSGLKHRGSDKLRLTSVIVVMTTFILCLFGTFLTRSGVVSSVHAFGESNMGVVLGSAIGLIVLACGVLIVWRLPQLRYNNPNRHSRGWLGQLILLILLVSMTVAVLWGTLYPLFNRVVNGQEIAVTPGFFNVVITPLALAVLFLFAVSPLLPNQTVENRNREIVIRVGVFAVVFGGIMLVTHFVNPAVALVLALAVLAIMTVFLKAKPRVLDAWREDSSPFWGSVRATGPYVGHVGLVVLLAAITLNVAFQTKEQAAFKEGEVRTVAGQVVRMGTLSVDELPDRQSFSANVELLDGNGNVANTITTRLEQYANQEQVHAEVGILVTPIGDIYVVLDSADASTGVNTATITVFNNPAVVWLWVGGALLVLGGVLYAIPRRRRPFVEDGASQDDTDREITELLDAAILAATQLSKGITPIMSDPVEDLLNKAKEIVTPVDSPPGTEADPDAVLEFLEAARARVGDSAEPVDGGQEPPVVVPKNSKIKVVSGPSSTPPVPPRVKNTMTGSNPSQGKPKGLIIVGAIVGVLLLVGGAYLLGHGSGSSVPSITGTPENTGGTSAASPAPAPSVDAAQVSALMEKIKANPKDKQALSDLGDIYFVGGDYKNAIAFFTKVTDLDPKNAYAWSGIGAASLNSGDMTKAKNAFEKAIAAQPTDAGSHYGLGLVYLSEGNSEKAKAEWQRVIDIAPNTDVAKSAADMLKQHGVVPSGVSSAGPLPAPASPTSIPSPSGS